MPPIRRGMRTGAWIAVLALLISIVAIVGGPPSTSVAASGATDPAGLWTPTVQKLAAENDGHRRMVNPSDYRGFTLDAAEMAGRLALAPLEDLGNPARAGVTVTVPGPTGELIDFEVVESSIMEDALQAAHPDIRTYAGSSVTEGYTASIRLDMTPLGFHASVRDGRASWYVDPAYLDDTSLYVSYFGSSLPRPERGLVEPKLDARTLEAMGVEDPPGRRPGAQQRVGEGPDGVVLQRVYRLALVTDASYAEFFAPGLNVNPLDLAASNAAVLAAKTTLMNRVNQIYNDDLAIKMIFVDNTDLLLNLNNPAREAAAGLAGVGETGCLPNALVQNQVAVDTLIGPLNYDIGHLALGVNGGGVAFLGVVGQQGRKAGGCTGLPSPVGDFMAIDYVAHEMGHQFAGPHTFNGTQGNCSGGNRTGGSSVEPGSGSSVMAYAGICAADDLQPHTDPYFSQRTQDEIGTYVTSAPRDPVTDTRGGFEVVTTTNHNPVVTAPADVTIPIRTPFTLRGSATDSDGDQLIYLWEQNDIGASAGVQLTNNTKVTGPLFRVFSEYADVSDADTLLYESPGQNLATTSPVRTFPDVDQIMAGNTNAATGSCPTPVASDYSGAVGTTPLKDGPVLDCYSEFLPTADYLGSGANAAPPRLTFRLTARDLTGEGGGTQHDQVTLKVDPAAGPFVVTSQGTPTAYDGGSTQPVTWTVNGTAGLAPDVRITMSTDGGDTFDRVLAASTPNDGTHDVVIPNVSTTTAWLKVEAVDNVFFDLSDAPFTVAAVPAGLDVTDAVPDTVSNQYSDGVDVSFGASTGRGDSTALEAVPTGLPDGLSLVKTSASAAGVVPATATWAVEGTSTGSPGSYPVSVAVTDGVTSRVVDFTIVSSQETATPTYTGDTAKTTAPGEGTVPVTLSATVVEEADGSPGDLATASATFTDTVTRAALCTSPVTAAGAASCTYDAAPGTYRVEVSLGGRYTGRTADDTTVVVTPSPSSGIVVTGTAEDEYSTQYSDDVDITFSATSDNPGADLEATATGLPRGLSLDKTGTAVAASWSVAGNVTDGLGDYPVSVEVNDGSQSETLNFVITVNREGATARYTGPSSATLARAKDKSAVVDLTASVVASADGTAGDITTARTTFTDTTTDTVLCAGVPVSATDTAGSGTSACRAELAPGSHTIVVTVDGRYVGASPESRVVVTRPKSPQTTLTSTPGRWNVSEKARFAFTSSMPGSTFVCTLDGVSEPCTSPYVASGLTHRTHVFSVAATNAGATDRTPARTRTTVPKAAAQLKATTKRWRLARHDKSYLGRHWRTSKPGQKLTFRLRNARALALVVAKGPSSGKVKVVFGGRTLRTISLKGPRADKQVVRLASFGRPVSGTVEIVTLRTRRSSVVRVEGLAVSTLP